MISENAFHSVNTFQNILTISAMKLIHAGQILLNQELQKIDQLSQEYEEENETDLIELLHDAALLFQLDFQNKDAIAQGIEQIDNFYKKHAPLPKALLPLNESVNDFKIYLQLVHTFNKALLVNSSNESEFIAQFENNLRPILQSSLKEIEKNPLLRSSLQNLMQCIQKLKLVKIQPRLKDEPISTRDKSRYQRWNEGIKAFKLYSSAPRVMSNHWIKGVLENNKKKPGQYFNDNFSVNQAGIDRFDTIIKSALSSQNEPINQDDLALLGILLDRKAVKKVMLRYGLKGDGSLDYPFSKNNLNALLLGLAANLNSDETKRLHPKALQVILQIKDSFKTSNELANPESILALQKEFEQEKQNKVPLSANNYLKKELYSNAHKLATKLTRYVGNLLIASINFADNEWFKENGVKLFDIFKPENSAYINLSNDIDLLSANAKTDQFIIDMPNVDQANKKIKSILKDLQNNTVRKFCLLHREYQFTDSELVVLKVYKDALNKGLIDASEVLLAKVKNTLLSKMNPWDNFVDAMMVDLKSLTFERFVKKYPAFKEGNCSGVDVLALKNASESAKSNLPEQSKLQTARTCITNKIHAIYPFARAALFSHILAYNSDFYSQSKKEVNFRLPLEDGKGANFAVKPIIYDEQGLAVTLFSPVEDVESETIPLVFMCEGSHDLLSLLRDLQPKGAGMEEFFSQKPYLHRIFSALNQEIELLEKKYPHKKVSIEIFGHSLGGADVYELLLAFQEAMAQNKLRSPAGLKDFDDILDINNPKGFLNAKDPELRESLPQALKESLGIQKRDFDHGYIDDRKFSPDNISAINSDRIANIKAYPKNGAGVHHKILSSIAATAAFLGKNGNYMLYDNPLDLSGDAVQRTGHGRGLYMASPNEDFFYGVIKLAHCKYNTLKDGFINQARLLAEGRLAPLEVHQDKIFDQGPMSWFQKDVKITQNDSHKNMKHLRTELYNPVTLDGKKAFVDIRAYIKVKSMIYFLLSMISAILLPIIEQSRKWVARADKKVSDTIGVISPRVDTENNVVLNKARHELLAKQKDLLLTPMHANKKLSPYLTSKPKTTSNKPQESHYKHRTHKLIKI